MSRWTFISIGLVVAFAGCSKHDHQVDRKPVFPVRGKLLVNDQPAAGAMVVLHPLNAPTLSERPRANVAPDGTFELTTYDGKDGAPVGEYAVTVEWRWPVDRGNGPVPGPNQLHPDYSLPGKSGLQIKVAEGPNELQPITIRR